MRQVEHSNWSIDSGYRFKLVDFGSSVYLYSIRAILSTMPEIMQSGSGERDSITSHGNSLSVGGDLLCTIVFIGADEDIALISTPAQ